MKHVINFDDPTNVPAGQSKRLLGGKGHNLAVMRRELDLPVPPGFTVTTETGLSYLRDEWPDGLDAELREHMSRIEEQVGRRFGGPGEPLLVSVRSGAPISMPGMMDTILNLGLNRETAAGLAEACGNETFTTSLRGRLDDMYREVVGGEVPEDPWQQLRSAIEAVFRSWNSARARAYREHEGIPDDMCTAVTVQTMVFGNMDDESATGVLFTRNPASGEATLYGDVMFRAQGEDVVAGGSTPEPIVVLDDRLPEVAYQLRQYGDILERHYRDLCDIEFTVERGTLWLLQVRIGKRSPQAALKIALEMAQDPDFPLSRAEAVERVAGQLRAPSSTVAEVAPDAVLLTEGLPASPGLASGCVAMTPERAISMADEGKTVILVRPETSPDDVHGMARVAGILTSHGGLASHAAVVARGWGIPAVVGAGAIHVSDTQFSVGDHELEEGDPITIDGYSGRVFAGETRVEADVTPEARTLLRWADELGIEIADRNDPSARPLIPAGGSESRSEAPSKETIVRALHIKGFATPENLAPVLRCEPEAVATVLDALVSEGIAKRTGEMCHLTEEGRSMGTSLLAADRERWTEETAGSALERFLVLDVRLKEIVTGWQMRVVDGEQVINDHADETYDRAILADLAEFHEGARRWLSPLIEDLPRLETYQDRLQRAADRVEHGSHDYIASPRLDSYHTIWFELHEDLIQLAGRTREEEAAAGRA
ncbi:MAG TPA: pyruvate, phosphate dikinase [Acidimicrobiia bacterium]|nr:pyruvate, phosphate dikinase [Acidimicrobiia bacterium]